MNPVRVMNVWKGRLGEVAVPFLGQGALEAAAAEVENAKLIAERVNASYGNLVESIGQADAKRAYDEAFESFKKAQERYDQLSKGLV